MVAEKSSLLLFNLRQVVQIVDDDTEFIAGTDMAMGKIKVNLFPNRL